jgi:hypothetical protein
MNKKTSADMGEINTRAPQVGTSINANPLHVPK